MWCCANSRRCHKTSRVQWKTASGFWRLEFGDVCGFISGVLAGQDKQLHTECPEQMRHELEARRNKLLSKGDRYQEMYVNALTHSELVAMVEILDPMVLGSRVCPVQVCEPCSLTIPVDVQSMFGDELVLGGDRQRLFVTLGQFSVIRLERPAQIIVPIVDYALPTKECCADPGGCAEDPCALFDKVPFPAEAFTPTGCDRREDGYQTL